LRKISTLVEGCNPYRCGGSQLPPVFLDTADARRVRKGPRTDTQPLPFKVEKGGGGPRRLFPRSGCPSLYGKPPARGSACPGPADRAPRPGEKEGSHHFGGNYKELAEKIIDALEH